MLYIKYLLSIWLILMIAGCAPVPTTTPAPTSVSTASLPALPTVSTTPANRLTLKAGQWAYIFYHEGLQQVVLVNGGPEQGKPADEPLELWGWDGIQWSLISADENGPTWRNWPAAAYDTTRDVLVLHGGLQSGANFDETWEWDGQTWTRFEGDGPSAREGALMAYDAARTNMILFGGSSPDMQLHGDTWTWDGQHWALISETGPAARFPGGMTYDPARQVVLMYSGHFASLSGESIDYDDLWAWDGSAWQEMITDGPTPDHRTHAGFVYDPVAKNVLLIGSGSETFLSDMWAWDGTKWQEIPTSNTPARSGLNVAYDPKRDRFVLFGGVDRPGGKALDDTWEWDRVQWSCVNNCQ
jgi:hypothetical protein